MTSKILRQQQCPNCASCGKDTSKDNLTVYEQDDGTVDGFCFACRSYFRAEQLDEPVVNKNFTSSPGESLANTSSLGSLLSLPSTAIPERHLTKETAQFYGVKQEGELRFYPRHRDGKLCGFKCRKLPKTFKPSEGAMPVGDLATSNFWGQHLFEKGNGLLIITEGEEDAMSVWQATAAHSPAHIGYAAVSVPDGWGSLEKTVKEQMLWLSQFDKVIFCLDQEHEVQAKVKEVCRLLPPRKAYVAKLSEKDASDMLVQGKDKQLYRAVWDAVEYKPDGLVLGSETWDIFKASKHSVRGIPLPPVFGMDHCYMGMVKGSLDVIGAFEKAGKSTMLKEIVLHILETTQEKVGLFMLEEFVEETTTDLMVMKSRRRIDLEPTCMTEDEKHAVWHSVFDGDRLCLSTAHAFLTIKDLLDRIRYMRIAHGVEIFFLDNLTKIVRLLSHEREGENFLTAKLMTELEMLCKELEIYICLVSHVRKEDGQGKSFSEGKLMKVHDLYGSGDVSKSAYNVLAISRDNSSDPNITQYHLIATRRGRIGRGNLLTYNFDTGRIETIVVEVGI